MGAILLCPDPVFRAKAPFPGRWEYQLHHSSCIPHWRLPLTSGNYLRYGYILFHWSATNVGLQRPRPLSQFGITLKSHPGSSGPIEQAEALLTTYRGSSSLFPVRPASLCDYRCKSESMPQSTVITESIYRKPVN